MLRFRLLLIPLMFFLSTTAQDLADFNTTSEVTIKSLILNDGSVLLLKEPEPFFSFLLDGQYSISTENLRQIQRGNWIFELDGVFRGEFSKTEFAAKGLKYILFLQNTGSDTLILENVVPFGQKDNHVYITSTGPWELARAKLFRPGYGPVRIVLPDNAWEMGYGSFRVENTFSLCAISRRTAYEGSVRRRYQTLIPPGGTVEYSFYFELYRGPWQEGLRLMFHDRWLHDLESFDQTLYERNDLKWIRDAKIIYLQFAWDQDFYSRDKNSYMLEEQMLKGKRHFGGYDVIGIWPTWPRLGVDERNQWDLYRDMPGGITALRSLSLKAKEQQTRFFIAYNPWDESTREEDSYKALTRIISAIEADGVVLDTRGKSSYELQQAADKARPGVVMYSEGMAVPEDMPGIVSGRVHDAIRFQPELNLNKLIKPEFGIFRVCHIRDGRLHREAAISFLNGIGTEIIGFAPGRPAWMDEEFIYLGKTTMILREHKKAFLDRNWMPLIETLQDSVWVNQWQDDEKCIYTVYSLLTGGYSGPLIELPQIIQEKRKNPKTLESGYDHGNIVNSASMHDPEKNSSVSSLYDQADININYHYISLWHHQEITPVVIGQKKYLPVKLDAFNKSYLGSRQEGANECIALFPILIRASRTGDSIRVYAEQGDRIKVWAGNPGYQNKSFDFPPGRHFLDIGELSGDYEDKIVVQLFRQQELLDECILEWPLGKPWLISQFKRTEKVRKTPEGMVRIPGGRFMLKVNPPDQFIPYPDYDSHPEINLEPFYIDIYPVTNKEYLEFIKSTGYLPADTINFLKHWHNGKYLPGTENYPVVNISYEDARAYAVWAGKRLPTEAEWQFAAQSMDGRKWPWGNEFKPGFCNPGGQGLMPVDSWPQAKSPSGACDLVGNVWQLTNDLYSNGSYRFVIMRGGSYYNPTSSIWYVKGGPQPLDQTQMLLLVSPGFDRCSTVGFRCVKDAY
jgi:iron(II)-dependent oxidoreductase